MSLREIVEFSLFTINGVNFTVTHLLSIVLIIGLTRLINVLVKVFLRRSQKKRKWLDSGKEYALSQIIKYIVYTIALVLILQTLGIDVTILIASSAALFVGIGLGLQDVFRDIISGFIILFERSVEVGDIIEMERIVGQVKDINIRTSKLKTRDDITVIVPNAKLLHTNVINWSEENKKTRFMVSVGVAYGSDTQLVEKILVECASAHQKVASDPEPFVRFQDFGNSSLDFELMFWSETLWRIEQVKSDIRFRIDQRFREEGIRIPFPQRDVHFFPQNLPKAGG
ncbi:MAG TPA: hypothetical protein DCS15_09515 [Flavobacteriales bacterium]|jgi:small-conductance mechanosensitive channel|nr:hypothetical protein [Flavobacteriales bacterium]